MVRGVKTNASLLQGSDTTQMLSSLSACSRPRVRMELIGPGMQRLARNEPC